MEDLFTIESLQNPILFFTILFVSNVLMFLLNVLISKSWNNYHKHPSLAYNRKDISLSIFVAIFINVVVAIPGYYLYLNEFINFTQTNFIRDFIIIFLLIDLLMYLLHNLSHLVNPFKWMHKEHHTHHKFNAISLYVMHPFEAIAFGLLLTVIPFLVSLNIYSFLFFLFINWLLGAISHLNTNTKKNPKVFGNNVFHLHHHKYLQYNYGFYTVIWDKMFGTYFKK